MRIYNLKKASIPKVVVLATGLVAAVLAGTLGPQAAQATPRAKNCAGCHAAGGSTTATPSTVAPVGGAAYTAAMTAPAAAGTYTYNVYTNQGLTDPDGQASSTTYSITVAPVVTVPPTTVPPTTEPPVQTAPTLTMTAPVNAYALTTTLAPAWSARDADGGLASSDVRWLRAPLNGAFTRAVYPSTWQRTTASSATLAGAAPGFTYCFSARARDNAGNVSPWTSPRCSAVALDDRSMYATAGWVRVTGGVFYRSTATVTSRRGVALVKTVQARRIYLVASRYPNGGTVGVFWNGRLIKTVSLQARSATHRSVLGLATAHPLPC